MSKCVNTAVHYEQTTMSLRGFQPMLVCYTRTLQNRVLKPHVFLPSNLFKCSCYSNSPLLKTFILVFYRYYIVLIHLVYGSRSRTFNGLGLDLKYTIDYLIAKIFAAYSDETLLTFIDVFSAFS